MPGKTVGAKKGSGWVSAAVKAGLRRNFGTGKNLVGAGRFLNRMGTRVAARRR